MDRIEIGKRLRELRGDRRPEEVAVAVGVSASAIAMYELGERIPRDTVKLALARYYGVPVGEIFFPDNAHSE